MSLNFMKVRYFNTQLNSPSVIYNGGCKLNVLLFQRGSNLSAFKCFFLNFMKDSAFHHKRTIPYLLFELLIRQ